VLWLLACHSVATHADPLVPWVDTSYDDTATVASDPAVVPLEHAHDPATPVDGTPAPGGLTVVIGGGVSGLATAMDLDGPVLLLEASEQLGGRALWAAARMLFVGNDEQIAAGAASDPTELIADWESLTGAPPDSVATRFLLESDGVRDRLHGLGVRFELTEADPVHARWRGVGVVGGGPFLVSVLAANLPGTVDVRLGVPATALVLDGGRVIGVDTEAGPVAADRVVIASGGFVNRADLVERVMEPLPGAWTIGEDDGAQGWAYEQAEALGLGIALPEAIGFNAHTLGLAGASGAPIDLDGMDAFWVDSAGERFVDETAWWSLLPWGAARARGGAWAISSLERLRDTVSSDDLPYLEAGLAAGVDARCADDDPALAGRLGVDPAGLGATREAIEELSASAEADEHGRPTFPSAEGTPCGYRVGRSASKNFGGLAVDRDGRVLAEDGAVVGGLWAVGEAAGMASPGLGGMSGFDGSLSAVVWSGWRAAAAMNAERR